MTHLGTDVHRKTLKRVVRRFRKLRKEIGTLVKMFPHTYTTLEKLPPQLQAHEADAQRARDNLRKAVAAGQHRPEGEASSNGRRVPRT